MNTAKPIALDTDITREAIDKLAKGLDHWPETPNEGDPMLGCLLGDTVPAAEALHAQADRIEALEALVKDMAGALTVSAAYMKIMQTVIPEEAQYGAATQIALENVEIALAKSKEVMK